MKTACHTHVNTQHALLSNCNYEHIRIQTEIETDLQTGIGTHCPITFRRLQSIIKVEQIFLASPAGEFSFLGGGILHLGDV